MLHLLTEGVTVETRVFYRARLSGQSTASRVSDSVRYQSKEWRSKQECFNIASIHPQQSSVVSNVHDSVAACSAQTPCWHRSVYEPADSFANSLVSEAGEAGVVETAITVGEQHEFTRMEDDVDRQRLLGAQPAFVGDPATAALTTDLQKKQRWVETEGGRTFKAQCHADIFCKCRYLQHGDAVQKDYDRTNGFRIVTFWSLTCWRHKLFFLRKAGIMAGLVYCSYWWCYNTRNDRCAEGIWKCFSLIFFILP